MGYRSIFRPVGTDRARRTVLGTRRPDRRGEPETFEERKVGRLGDDGVPFPVEFEATPGEVGKRRYTIKVIPPEQDHDPSDNSEVPMLKSWTRRTASCLSRGADTGIQRFCGNCCSATGIPSRTCFCSPGSPEFHRKPTSYPVRFPADGGRTVRVRLHRRVRSGLAEAG
jgi:hypothetical protein